MSSVAPPAIHRARCLNHPEREAVMRCPDCGHYFCRECVVEHEGRMTCATCLNQSLEAKASSPGSGRMGKGLRKAGLRLLTFLLAWGLCILLGRVLLFLRSSLEGLWL